MQFVAWGIEPLVGDVVYESLSRMKIAMFEIFRRLGDVIPCHVYLIPYLVLMLPVTDF